ncbi:MAG: peptide deformylase [Chloroflexi bacterium]|nr:peptide deformylase [Chloroflexota bacterium]
MSLLPILELPHPILRKRARKVRRVDKKLLKLAYDMVDTMEQAGGVGLAANQVGQLHRLIVIRLPDEEARIYINPEILKREGEREVEEGCLSVPGYKGYIMRSVWVRFGAIDHESVTVKFKADDLLAQALEHEVDHLDGILYLDHLESHEDLIKIETNPTPEDSEDEGSDDGDASASVDEAQALDIQHEETPASMKVN